MRKKVSLQMVVKAANLPRVICTHFLGKNHTISHRAIVGLCIMVFGVTVAKNELFANSLYHFVCDLVGYGIHGIGLTPFLEKLIDSVQQDEGES